MKRWGFTLIEMMVVVALIAILLTIVLAVGSGVKSSAARRATMAELKTLDGLMRDYLAAGNPEPQPDSTWRYTASSSPAVYAPTSPASDPCNWVIALESSPDAAAKLHNLRMATDRDWPKVSPVADRKLVLDAFNAAIRYVPGSGATPGYFVSAGPDGVWSTMSPAPASALRADEIRSTDPQ